jgi:hypothetical protein
LADAKAKLLETLHTFTPSSQQQTLDGEGTAPKRDPHAALASTDGVRAAFMPNTPASFLLLLVNYLTSLRLTKNTEELSDDFCQKVKEALYLLNEFLSDKERSTIHLERRMELFAVLPLQGLAGEAGGGVLTTKDYLQQSFTELTEHRRQHHVRVEKEKLKRRLEEFKGAPNTRKEGLIMTKHDQQIGMEMLALVDPKKAARIKFHRQQKEARKKRSQSIKERNKMYRMVASDEISALFFQQAKKVDEDCELEWGDDKLLVVEDPFKLQQQQKSEGQQRDEDQGSEASDDSFASKLKKVKHVVDTSLANIQYEPNKPMYMKSPGREEEQVEGGSESEEEKVETKSEVSSVSELTTPMNVLAQLSDPTKAVRRESRIMSWLMRNRGGGGG